MEFLIAWKNTLGTSELPQARETLLRRIVAGLPEELSTRIPKKFIDFVPLRRACLKNHSYNLHAPICGIFCPIKQKLHKNECEVSMVKIPQHKSQNSTNFFGIFPDFLSNPIEYLYLQRLPISNTTN